MGKATRLLMAGVMTPALLAGQAASSLAETGGWTVAQAQIEQRKPHPPGARFPAPPAGRPPAVHQPVAPRAAAPVAPKAAAPVAPRVAPPAPRLAPPQAPVQAAPHPAPTPRGAPAPVGVRPSAPGPARPPLPAQNAAPAPVGQHGAPSASPLVNPALRGVAPTNGGPGHGARSGAPGGANALQPLRPPATLQPPIAQPGGAPQRALPGALPPRSAPGAPPRPPVGAAQPAQPTRVPDYGGARPAGQGAPPPGQQPARAGRLGPAGAAAIGAAAGLVGGFMLSRPGQAPHGIEGVRRDRREFSEGGAFVYQEPGRTIVREDNRYFLRHDENERFRALGGDMRSERRGDEFVTIYRRPSGDEIVTVTDAHGNLIRRYRRARNGVEVVIIDNRLRGGPRAFVDDVVVLPPPPMRLPPDRYIVDTGSADERLLYDTLTAPPVARIPRRYTLDEIRYSPDVRAYTRAVDLNTINFDTGSWAIAPDQARKLASLARALNQAIERNPNEVYLVEGHTDAVGSAVDNLSLSDRRAQAVAETLTKDFGVPPENLVTQGYGEQNLRVQTEGPERRNRRVTIRRITNLLSGQNG